MIQEALQYLIHLGKESGAKVIPTPGPKHEYIIERRDGTLTEKTAEPEPRDHKALDLSAVIAFATDYDAPSVWYSRHSVTCLVNDEERRDKVRLSLDWSPPMKALMQLEARPDPMKQSQLVLLLRTTFARCLAPAGDILTAVRSLKFSAGSDGASSIQHTSVSVGRAIRSEITGAKVIPEEITLDVPIFANAFAFTGRVQCAIDIDPGAETFKLIPLPLEIERAVVSAEKRIAELLAEGIGESAPIYYGNP